MTQLGMFTTEAPVHSYAPFVHETLEGDEIVVDSFAGGGGASEGIRRALGYSPHKAINHDPPAIALHAANHPDSEHFPENVWRLDPVKVCGGRPVGLMWLSPDCTHFSKAKGSKPVSKKIRGLAWVAVRWAQAVQPRIIILENVEEFEKWGPLYASNHPNPKLRDRPVPEKQGHTYRAFERKLKRLGYVVEKRQLVACDYGAPTSRKRLFIIARCDGEPIVWPKPTHGPGRPHAWRIAAECIDWTIPVHSIFLTADDAKRLWKERRIRIKRPLVANTLRRIGRGVWRFVINNPKPYIVPYRGEKRAGEDRSIDLDQQLPTQDTSNRFAIVTPFIAGVGGRQGQSPERGVDRPYQTVTGKADSVVVQPIIVPVAPFITKFRTGTAGPTLDQPMPTVVPTQNGAQLCATFLAKHFGGHETPGAQLEAPMPTTTARDHHAVVAAHISKFYGDRIGSAADEPLGTVMATSAKHAVVAAHLQRDFGKSVGSPSDALLPTITGGGGGHAALVASSLVKFKGTSNHGQPVDEPLHMVQSGGNHYAEVRAFLTKYYSTSNHGQGLGEPLHTVIANDRFGLVTVSGQDYVIVDIGMRMLVPRELARAQGFHDSYVLDIEFNGKPLSKEAQTSMIGNSVSPDHAHAVVAANYRPRSVRRQAVG